MGRATASAADAAVPQRKTLVYTRVRAWERPHGSALPERGAPILIPESPRPEPADGSGTRLIGHWAGRRLDEVAKRFTADTGVPVEVSPPDKVEQRFQQVASNAQGPDIMSPVVSASGSPSAAPWFSTPTSSCSTSRCPISTPPCG
jgi:hypothetical protein